MSDTHRTLDTNALSEFVEAPDYETATRAAKLTLIAAGKTPGHVIHVDDFGDGTWEIVYTNRPLRADQSFGSNGVRYGNAGSKADPLAWA